MSFNTVRILQSAFDTPFDSDLWIEIGAESAPFRVPRQSQSSPRPLAQHRRARDIADVFRLEPTDYDV